MPDETKKRNETNKNEPAPARKRGGGARIIVKPTKGEKEMDKSKNKLFSEFAKEYGVEGPLFDGAGGELEYDAQLAIAFAQRKAAIEALDRIAYMLETLVKKP